MKHGDMKRIAQDLEPGQSLRTTHIGCSTSGTSTNLSLTRTPDGILFNCFKCGDHGFIPDSISFRKSGGPSSTKVSKPRYIPSGATSDPLDWHPEAMRWVLRYLDLKEINSHGICGYHNWVYIPISAGRFLMRPFGPESRQYPKYINQGSPPYYAVVGGVDSSSVVLVEDAISAICITRTGRDAVALLGTRLSDEAMSYLVRRKYRTVYVWLDNDNTNVRMHAQKIRQKCELICDSVVLVDAERDPKDLTTIEMDTLLC